MPARVNLAADLPLRAELLVDEGESGELVLVDAANNVVGNRCQHRLLACKFRVKIDSITCASLKFYRKTKFLVTSLVEKTKEKLTTLGLNGGRTLRCSNCSQSMSEDKKNVSKVFKTRCSHEIANVYGSDWVVAGILKNELGIS